MDNSDISMNINSLECGYRFTGFTSSPPWDSAEAYWAIPEKIQTEGEEVEDMEFPEMLKKEHVEIPGIN